MNNGKIIIKDLRESRLYHDLINEVELKEELKNDIQEEEEEEYYSCNSHDIEEKKKKKKKKG